MAKKIKKDPGRNEVTLSEIKKNLQGTNSGGDEAKNQIIYLGGKEVKSIQSEQQEEKRILKNQEGHLGNKSSKPQARPHSPGFQSWENKAS